MNQPLPAPNISETTDSRALSAAQVAAQVLQNVLGGLGAGVAVAAVLWLAGADLATWWRWPAGVAILVAGASTAWRAYLDEYRAGRNWQRREQEHAAEMIAVILDLEDAEAERDAWRNDALALRERVQWLELRAKEPLRINGVPQALETDPAYKDAEALIQKQYGDGIPVALRRMQANGWTQARYTAALEVLKAAGIVEVRGTQTTWASYPSPAVACMDLHGVLEPALQLDATMQRSEAA